MTKSLSAVLPWLQVEEVLQHAIEQHVEEVQLEQVRWLNTAQEKVAWCQDVSGDKYSIEAKMQTIHVSHGCSLSLSPVFSPLSLSLSLFSFSFSLPLSLFCSLSRSLPLSVFPPSHITD